MARRCDLSGVGPLVGNNVSHSNIKTKRRFLPNLCDVSLSSETLGRSFPMTVAAKTLRTVDKLGGLDEYLRKADESKLSTRALRIKRDIASASRESLTEVVQAEA